MDVPHVAVVGAGHMGRHHARVYHLLAQRGLCRLVAVVDKRPDAAHALADEFACEALADTALLPGRVQAASIVTPTTQHLACAAPLLQAGIACLVEKPLAPDSAAAEELVRIARDARTMLSVGHIERFNPVVRAIRERGVRPRFIEAHRISPFSFRSADVSVVLDMMIHDIDVVLSLIGSEPATIDAVGVAVIGRAQDVVSARLRFPDGSVADLTASRLAIKTERKIRCFSPDAYVSMDYQKKTGLAIFKQANDELLEQVRRLAGPDGDLGALAGAGFDYTRLVNIEPLTPSATDQLEVELTSFLQAVRDATPPEVSGEDGLAAVRTAERIEAACINPADPPHPADTR